MFSVGFNASDLRRVLWTFLLAVGAYAIAQASGWVSGGKAEWPALVVGALAAGGSAVKNLVLSDGSSLK